MPGIINNINTGEFATTAEAQAGTNQRKLLSPATLADQTALRIGGGIVRNLGMRIDAGNLVICAADGSDLSVSNFGKMLGVVNNLFSELTFSSNITLNVSFLNARLFNTRTGVAWNEDYPLYIYVVADPTGGTYTTPSLGIAPCYLRTNYSTASPNGLSIFYGTANQNTPACLGSFRARKDSSDVWTIQALNQTDGVGQFKENVWFNMPTGQWIANSYFVNGTAPQFTTQRMRYKQDATGNCHVEWYMSGDGGTDGVGTASAELWLPFECTGAGALNRRGQSAQAYFAGTTRTNLVCDFQTSASSRSIEFFRVDSTAKLQVGNFSAGDRYFTGYCTYRIRNVSAEV